MAYPAKRTVGELVAELLKLDQSARVFGSRVTPVIVVPQNDGSVLVTDQRD